MSYVSGDVRGGGRIWEAEITSSPLRGGRSKASRPEVDRHRGDTSRAWVTQQACDLSFTGLFERVRFLIHDSRFSATFDEVFRSEGTTVIRTPIRAPQANAYAERFVRTVRAECLDWLLIIGRRQLESVLRIYTAHYNRERPHRGLALLTPDSPNADARPSAGEIKRRDRLGGLIHEYHRAAA
jgi:putative transposase